MTICTQDKFLSWVMAKSCSYLRLDLILVSHYQQESIPLIKLPLPFFAYILTNSYGLNGHEKTTMPFPLLCAFQSEQLSIYFLSNPD